MHSPFYRRLAGRSRRPLLLLLISAVCLIMACLIRWLAFSNWPAPGGAFWRASFGDTILTVAVGAIVLFSIAFEVLLIVGAIYFFFGRRSRKATMARYRALTDLERAEIDREAASLQKGTLLYGAHNAYFTLQYSNMPCFLNYRDAVWVYLCLNGIPVPENPVALSVQIGANATVHFYDRGGTHYSVSARRLSHCDTREVIGALREHFPDALYGYSKERAQAAKSGFPT